MIRLTNNPNIIYVDNYKYNFNWKSKNGTNYLICRKRVNDVKCGASVTLTTDLSIIITTAKKPHTHNKEDKTSLDIKFKIDGLKEEVKKNYNLSVQTLYKHTVSELIKGSHATTIATNLIVLV